MKTMQIAIAGMTCGHCAMAVKKELSKVPFLSVENVEIGKARVTVDESKVSSEAIQSAVKEAGYTVVSIQ